MPRASTERSYALERRDSKRRWKALIVISLISMALSITSFMFNITASHASTVNGAAFTTVNEGIDGAGHCQNGNPLVNCNIYDGKQYVWMNGGPVAASLGDGTYFFAVLDPGSQLDPNDGAQGNLSDTTATSANDQGTGDAYTNRTFSILGSTVSYSGLHTFDSNLIRLMPYDDTSNPGGVYILAICSLANGTHVAPQDCKYDAFKINTGQTQSNPDLGVSKTAFTSYTNTYNWSIGKSADKTTVKQVGGSVSVTYTITLTNTGQTPSAWQASGDITINNSSSVTFVGVSLTDWVTDAANVRDPNVGTKGTCLSQSGLTIPPGATSVAYTCTWSAKPSGFPTAETNNVEIDWDQAAYSTPDSFATANAPIDWGSANVTPVNDCVNVTDSFNGANPATHLGQFCASGVYTLDSGLSGTAYANLAVSYTAPTFTLTYSRSISVPQFGCTPFPNTATITETGLQDGSSVTLCGPAKTGALTMGFWQNKNGQGIIKNSASTAGVCNLTTWLRQYAPFQDLSASASCLTVATYVYNVIKAANASGSSMNAMLKAQMLATALDVYYSDTALGGNKIGAPAPIGGVAIDLTKVCAMIDGSGGTATCSGNYENVSSAFGGASSLTVSQMLSYAASQSNAGGSVWYGQVKATQGLAKDAFDAINNQVAFGA